MREINLEEEAGTDPELTSQLELTVHLSKYLVAYGKTQPDTVWVNLLIVVSDLPKHSKELSLVLWSDTNPTILD